MKPRLKAQDCTDHDPIESWRPEDPAAVDYWLCLHIGPAEEEGADVFHVNVLSEVAACALPEDELMRRRRSLFRGILGPRLCRQLMTSASEGVDWSTIAEKLRTKFDWEFEDYRPHAL